MSDKTILNGGIRWEHYDRKIDTNASDIDLDDSTVRKCWIYHNLNDGWNLSSNLNYTERLPDTAELYSYGEHHATHAFEIGNPNLR